MFRKNYCVPIRCVLLLKDKKTYVLNPSHLSGKMYEACNSYVCAKNYLLNHKTSK